MKSLTTAEGPTATESCTRLATIQMHTMRWVRGQTAGEEPRVNVRQTACPTDKPPHRQGAKNARRLVQRKSTGERMHRHARGGEWYGALFFQRHFVFAGSLRASVCQCGGRPARL